MENFNKEERFAFPPYLHRVTGGNGGEAFLILGPEKTALYDAGMACFAEEMIQNIKNVLDGTERTLDYLFASHSHYDHIGGLPYVVKEWPKILVCGSKKASQVFQSDGAKGTIQRMGVYAKDAYGKPEREILVDGLRVDRILEDFDKVSLGIDETGRDWQMIAIETLGHTDCSMSYLLEPTGILFTSESTGVYVDEGRIEVTALKGHDKSIEAAKKLKAMDFAMLLSPHYGLVPAFSKDSYFDLYIRLAEEEYILIDSMIEAGLSDDEILEAHEARYWYPERQKEQPYEAYRLNAENTLKFMRNTKKL